MTASQTVFNTTFGIGVAGMRANTEPENVISRTVESAAGIAFGQPAFRGSGDHGCVVGGTQAGTSVGAAVAGNTGAATITAAPPVAAGAKQGVYKLTAISAGATAIFLMEDPDGIELGEVTTGTPATIGGIGPFTITDAGTDPAIGDQFTITVTFTANAALLGFVVIDPSVPALAATPDLVPQNFTASIMNEGILWVTAGVGGATDGSQAYWNPATLKYTMVATHVLLPGCIFDTTAIADGLVRLAIRKRIQ